MIEKILVTNVERLRARRYCALGVLASLGYPINSGILSFHKSHDRTLYDTIKAVKEAAVKDGFPFFEDMERHGLIGVLHEKNAVVWLWTWVSCLREIIEADKLTLLLIDDRSPTITWERMNKMVGELYDEEFNGIQLDVSMNLRLEYESVLPTFAVNSSCGAGFLCENDMGFVLSPKGAMFLLDKARDNPGDMPYTTTKRRLEAGFYHVLESVTGQNCYWPQEWTD